MKFSYQITLAAVYTPVALQGGLTGALFREFAFALAGAVVVSGVVALTLSPMMGSRLLRKGDTERGFAGMINRHFGVVRGWYERALGWTLRDRPSVLALWAIVVALGVPFYLFSMKELAPVEDQGVAFGIVQSSANSTLDQTRLFAPEIDRVYQSYPETGNTFQILGPTGGFGGIILDKQTIWTTKIEGEKVNEQWVNDKRVEIRKIFIWFYLFNRNAGNGFEHLKLFT